MKNEQNYVGFLMSKVWQILKRFAGTFCQAQTLKLWGVFTQNISFKTHKQNTMKAFWNENNNKKNIHKQSGVLLI